MHCGHTIAHTGIYNLATVSLPTPTSLLPPPPSLFISSCFSPPSDETVYSAISDEDSDEDDGQRELYQIDATDPTSMKKFINAHLSEFVVPSKKGPPVSWKSCCLSVCLSVFALSPIRLCTCAPCAHVGPRKTTGDVPEPGPASAPKAARSRQPHWVCFVARRRWSQRTA